MEKILHPDPAQCRLSVVKTTLRTMIKTATARGPDSIAGETSKDLNQLIFLPCYITRLWVTRRNTILNNSRFGDRMTTLSKVTLVQGRGARGGIKQHNREIQNVIYYKNVITRTFLLFLVCRQW